jgi:hypothetical protein
MMYDQLKGLEIEVPTPLSVTTTNKDLLRGILKMIGPKTTADFQKLGLSQKEIDAVETFFHLMPSRESF